MILKNTSGGHSLQCQRSSGTPCHLHRNIMSVVDEGAIVVRRRHSVIVKKEYKMRISLPTPLVEILAHCHPRKLVEEKMKNEININEGTRKIKDFKQILKYKIQQF